MRPATEESTTPTLDVELSPAGRMYYRSGEKSISTAAIASIIPGLGHAYAGSWGLALITFFLVAPVAWGLSFAAGTSLDSSVAFIVVLLSFYALISWSATESAKRKNEERMALAMTMH